MIDRLPGKKIGVIGVAFKDGTDDLRYSPIISVIEHFNGRGRDIRVFDKYVCDALEMGINTEYLERYTPYLKDMIRPTESEIVEWADVIVINKKDNKYTDYHLRYPDKSFFELVRNTNSVSGGNYEGIGW
jgi:GDP-mannose 6-dehydrogenase